MVTSADDPRPQGQDGLDPDDENADLEPSGESEADLDPDDDSVDPDEMNIPADPEGS